MHTKSQYNFSLIQNFIINMHLISIILKKKKALYITPTCINLLHALFYVKQSVSKLALHFYVNEKLN